MPQATPGRQQLEQVSQELLPNILTHRPVLPAPSIQQIVPSFHPPRQEFQYHLPLPNLPQVSQATPSSTATTTVQYVPQGIQSSKQELQQAPQLSEHSTKAAQIKPQTVHKVENQMEHLEIATKSVCGKPLPVTNDVVNTSVSSPFHKVSTPVKNSSPVNILATPITTPSCIQGPILEDRLESLERNLNQLFTFITNTLTNKNENTKTGEVMLEKAMEEKIPEQEKMFDDDNESVIDGSSNRGVLSQEIGNIISTDSLFEQDTNVVSYQQFKDKVSLNSTVHERKAKKKQKVSRTT